MINIRVSFTGTTSPGGSAHKTAEHWISKLRNVHQFNSGAAYGMDTMAYEFAVKHFPEAEHRVYVPRGKFHNAELVRKAEEAGHVIIYVSGGYMARNDALVANADLLVAFPSDANQEVLRSGTWATIRRARRKGIPVHLFSVG